MHKYIYISLFFILSKIAVTQELSCQVSVISTQIQGTVEKQIFEQLQKAIYEFMNNTKWTKDNYTTSEKIDCSILINVTQKLGVDEYRGTIQVQSRRPVFKSSYFSPKIGRAHV